MSKSLKSRKIKGKVNWTSTFGFFWLFSGFFPRQCFKSRRLIFWASFSLIITHIYSMKYFFRGTRVFLPSYFFLPHVIYLFTEIFSGYRPPPPLKNLVPASSSPLERGCPTAWHEFCAGMQKSCQRLAWILPTIFMPKAGTDLALAIFVPIDLPGMNFAIARYMPESVLARIVPSGHLARSMPMSVYARIIPIIGAAFAIAFLMP